MQHNLIDNIYNNLRVLNEYIKKTFEASMAYKYKCAHKKHKCYACGKYGHIAKHCNKICLYCGSYHGDSFCYRELFNLSNKIIYIFLSKSPKEFVNEVLKFQYIGNGVRYKVAGERLNRSNKNFIDNDGDLYKKQVGDLVIYKRISDEEKLQGLLNIVNLMSFKRAQEYVEKCVNENKNKESNQIALGPWGMFGFPNIKQVGDDTLNSSVGDASVEYDDSKDFKKVEDEKVFKENPFRNVLNGDERNLLKLRRKNRELKKQIEASNIKLETLTKHINRQKVYIDNNTRKQQRQKDAFLNRRGRYKNKLDKLNRVKNKIYNDLDRKVNRFKNKISKKQEILNLGYKQQRINKLEYQLLEEEQHLATMRLMHPTSTYIEKSEMKINRIKDELDNLYN